ncbi:MAG: GNAT family N-acetyltransferase [Xanthobacteraceae bacterium]
MESDDRTQFDCGRESLNQWLRRHAWVNHVADVSRTNVICHATSLDIVGYVTLSAAQVERAFLAKPHQRNKPDPLPATLLGQLAVHKDHQGRGHARSLLLFALRTALLASREIGSFGVLTHPIDDQVRAFYTRWGFQDLPYDPRRAMIVRMIDLEKSGIGR